MHVRVAINGHDYTDENENTLFTFVGTATLFLYWPYIIGILLGLLALIALIICCSAALNKMAETEVMERARKPGQESASAGLFGKPPHTLRDEFGFYRTRGYFQGHQQSPAPPGTRSTVYNPPSAKAKPMIPRSPISYNI